MNDLRAAILGADDLPREPVDVPWELGGQKLYVRGLSSNEKDEWGSPPNLDTSNATAELLAKCFVTEDGERVFTDEDAVPLGRKAALILRPLADTLDPTVTLVTCYPFYFVGHAPQRFIVRGTYDWNTANRTPSIKETPS